MLRESILWNLVAVAFMACVPFKLLFTPFMPVHASRRERVGAGDAGNLVAIFVGVLCLAACLILDWMRHADECESG